jgi:hypothetical protein
MKNYLADVDLGLLGNPIKSTFSLFFLNLEGDSFDWTTLNTLHKMGSKSSNLVAKTFCGDLGNFGKNLFVNVEVVG